VECPSEACSEQTGFKASTINPESEHRSSSQTSYLDQAIDDTTLKVYTRALARRILFNSNKKATGVQVTPGTYTNEQTYTLSATKEVILLVGAFQFPQLLMVSGTRPQDTHSGLGISIIPQLEGVGQNVRGHISWATTYAVNVETSSMLMNTTSESTHAAEAAYTQNATPQFPPDWPELEYLVETAYSGVIPSVADQSNATLANALITPLSRGNITINSTSTADPPITNPNWFTHPVTSKSPSPPS
jgi:choline dehydrogenase